MNEDIDNAIESSEELMDTIENIDGLPTEVRSQCVQKLEEICELLENSLEETEETEEIEENDDEENL